MNVKPSMISWKTDEIDKLKNCINDGMFLYQISKIINRSVPSIQNKLIQLKLNRRSNWSSKWDNTQDNILKEMLSSNQPIWQIALKVEKSYKSVRARIKKLNIKTDKYQKDISSKKFKEIHGNNDLTKMIEKRYNAAKSRAKEKFIEFNITKDFLIQLYHKQNGKCYFSNIEMKSVIGNIRNRNNTNPYSISVDRINSTKGYTEDNVVLCCNIVNIMKNGLPEKEFLDICQKITNTYSSKFQG